ncbi:hypothetical protein [Chryseobacterium sp. LAM-KRS1]|uniref:hypothetical protein n=1 Tax=Chryseobacterium sp. LAM-KRS1 TaxID=2715754 RepID=UPI001553AB10|nr:hypothetical protein [Chryseobacterium sp. LAM-KRS1]
MSLFELQKGTNFLETLENYSLAAVGATEPEETEDDIATFYTDEEFWYQVLNDPDYYWNKKVSLVDFVISDWIARVPGLYYMPSSKNLRLNAESNITKVIREFKEFNPTGKSQMVMGGIGTLLLPPTSDGKILMSATSSFNSSLGIPLLIFPEVLNFIKHGFLVRIKEAKWQAMEETWSKRFASTDNIPRGYLVIDSIEKIEIMSKYEFPVVYHPFSIMEYEKDEGYFYDYVYVTSDSKSRNAEDNIVDFFHNYAKKEDRFGEYLISSNMVNPLFPSRYVSSSDLNKESERANLELLQHRIRDTFFKKVSLEQLMIKLPIHYDSLASLKTLSRMVGINPNRIMEGSAVEFSNQLINQCIKQNKIETLVDRLTYENVKIFK